MISIGYVRVLLGRKGKSSVDYILALVLKRDRSKRKEEEVGQG